MKKMILLLLLNCAALAPALASRMVTGHVFDASNKQPLVGVAIRIEGGFTGAATDINGYYHLSIPGNNTTLMVIYIGYETQKVKVGKQSTLNIYLKPSKSTLDEVVVMGYGVSEKRDITGSVANMSPAPMYNQSLAGRVAGIQITGAQQKNKIRGIYMPAPQESESYKGITENGFQNPNDNPLSTFSVDVDAASYSNIRRFINNGQLPPKDAVRIEEMINYFAYNLPAPTNGEPVAIHTELSAAPWNPKHRLLRIGLKARVVATNKLPASNLVFLIDVSGSMFSANKLPLVQSSLKMLVDQLRPQDKVAIVVYAGAAGLVLPSTSGDQKTTIKDAIDRLQAGGSTAGGEGIKLAYKTAKQNFLKSGNNRVIMATDGDFNVGASSDQDMEQLIEQERKSGVFLSVLGYGMGNYKDSKMETLADKGNGNYAYIDNITEARKTLVSEFGGTLFTVAKDVKLQLEFNPARVASYRLIGYENRMLNKEDFNNDLKDAGDMGAGHNVTALYEIIPAGVHDKFTNSVDPLKYQKSAQATTNFISNDMLTIKFRYKEPNGSVSKVSQAVVIDQPVALASTTNDFRFASAVAEIGMLLRDSEFKQNAKYDEAIKRARAAKGSDNEGYRAEFIKLAESAKLLSKSALAAVEE
ncbi:von Willebrand factor type A domain-containing protein [Mucilaginibacter sp. PAMB04168]|uniref:vWA domain-containing protein n=1 Tax=Mucilaginibacter sp. PAMB04168 TaxID=3138567 RepID=UPI0031F66F2E